MLSIAFFIFYVIPFIAFMITAVICVFSKSMRDSIKTPFYLKDLFMIILMGCFPVINFIIFIVIFGEQVFGKLLDKEL